MTWLGATENLLHRIGRPAQVAPLASYLVDNEKVQTRAKNPPATLRTTLRREIRTRLRQEMEQRFYLTADVVGLTSYDPKQFSVEARETFGTFESQWEPAFDESALSEESPSEALEPPPMYKEVRRLEGVSDPPPEKYVGLPVWFATDRNRTEDTSIADWYGRDRGELSYGRITASIPNKHRIGRIERPRWWQSREENPDRDITLRSGELWSDQQFAAELRNELAIAQVDALVFVHGYNVTFGDAIYRTAQIAYDLKYDGIPLCFSWPSQGTFAGYLKDETNNEWSEPHLDQVLTALAQYGVERIHLLSHSMGGRSTARVIGNAVGVSKAWPHHLAQLVFAAPDIDTDVFLRIVSSFHPAERATIYASDRDEAIKASHRFHGYPRAGDLAARIVVAGGLDTIDASKRDTSLMGHSYFSKRYEVLNDLYVLVAFGHEPERRFGLQQRLIRSLPYWVFSS